MATANIPYRVGDYVYFETTSNSPYHVRRIEKLNKTPAGYVEAKVLCYFRRRDLPNILISLADKHQQALETDGENVDRCKLKLKERYQLKHRELFLSRKTETLPVIRIRGKCSVTLLNETESLFSYLNKEDTFFYCLVYDPYARTLLDDRGEIRVSSRCQADIPMLLREGELEPRKESMETLIWTPEHNLTDKQIDQFLVTSRSVGTFARTLDCSRSIGQPSLYMSAVAASRDITLFHAMDTLHKHHYDLSEAVNSLVNCNGPVVWRDEIEEWSESEAYLFEEAIEKYRKDFNSIRRDFLPWKTIKNIIGYYYMWKTTDRYVQNREKFKNVSKLTQVYIPTSISNKNLINKTKETISDKPCESCEVSTSQQWFLWGSFHLQYNLCQLCWDYWKKYGGLKNPITRSVSENVDFQEIKKENDDDQTIFTSFIPHQTHRCSFVECGKEFEIKNQLLHHYDTSHKLDVRDVSASPMVETRTAFYLATTPIMRLSRRLCQRHLATRHAARAPFVCINTHAIISDCHKQIAGKSSDELKALLHNSRKDRGSITEIIIKLGVKRNHELLVPESLASIDLDKMPKSESIAFPKLFEAPYDSLFYEETTDPESNYEKDSLNSSSPKSTPFDELNSIDTILPSKSLLPIGRVDEKEAMSSVMDSTDSIQNILSMSSTSSPSGEGPISQETVVSHLYGEVKEATTSQTNRIQAISWKDAPEEIYFRVNKINKKDRCQLTSIQLKRAARKTWRKLSIKGIDELIDELE